MSSKTSIEWTGRTWNPLVAYLKRAVWVQRKNGERVIIPAGTRGWFCTKCSPGCLHCYAEKINLRLGNGLTYQIKNLEEIEFRLVNLDAPLRWRKPGFVFVNSMTDLFHESVSDELIDQVFVGMAIAPRQTFQVLTKRSRRMREYLSDPDRLEKIYNIWYHVNGGAREVQAWPLPNVWLGVSAENQKYWDERVADLIKTPAAVRFVSAEPLLGPIGISPWLKPDPCGCGGHDPAFANCVDWIIAGGESGTGARPCNLNWLREIIAQCRSASVPAFVKQVGSRPTGSWPMAGNDGASGTVDLREAGRLEADMRLPLFKHPKGGEMGEWPEDLRVRQIPERAR